MSEFADITLSFRRGDVSMTLRATNRVEMEALITDVEKSTTLGSLMGVGDVPAPAAVATAEAATEPTEAEALAKIEEHLGAKPETTEELASETLLKVVAKKTGKSVDELRGITKVEAKRLEKEAK